MDSKEWTGRGKRSRTRDQRRIVRHPVKFYTSYLNHFIRRPLLLTYGCDETNDGNDVDGLPDNDPNFLFQVTER